jgi:general secretion pathway protein A
VNALLAPLAALAEPDDRITCLDCGHHLSGLTREELPAYLTHRLQLAGCALPLFEPPAIEALYHATQGLPRKVNRAAHYALSAAALAKVRQITAEHIQCALDEVQP